MENEKRTGAFTKTLTVSGTLLVWIPIAFTVFTSIVGTVVTGMFRLDYLMPAELGLFAVAGAVLLILAGFRSGLRRKLIGVSSVLAAFFFGACIVIAEISGMASGRTEAAGMPFMMAILMLALYAASLIGIGAGGILLWKDLFGKR